MKLISVLAASALAEFNSQPTGGVRPCEFYKMTATAVFDSGSTESVPDAMHNGATAVTGSITFEQNSCGGGVTYSGNLVGLGEGSHGWHVHTLGNAQAGCGSAFTGGHWNPYGASTGAVDASRKNREVGQIGNVVCDAAGNCPVDEHDHLIRLHGLRSIVGRSLVVHQNEDMGAGGGSGGRVACATIMWSHAWEEL